MSSRMRTGAPTLLICLLALGFPLSRAGAAEGLPENPPPELLCIWDPPPVWDPPSIIKSLDAGDEVARSRLREYVLIIPALITAAEAGDVQAASTLGMFYALGLLGDQDQIAAVRWLRTAAERGNMEAQFQLGRLYQRGKGVERDLLKAAEWFGLAAKQGHAQAQFALGY